MGSSVSVIGTTSLQNEEAVIDRGLATFVEVGRALQRIRDGELYREAGFDGFVEYLEGKPWGITQRRAYQMIDSASVCTMVQLKNERQARELAPLLKVATPDVVREVYAEVVLEATPESPVTAAKIREKVRAVLPERMASKSPTGRIEQEVVPALKSLLKNKTVQADWDDYSQPALKSRIDMLERAKEKIDDLLVQAKGHLGHGVYCRVPTKEQQ